MGFDAKNDEIYGTNLFGVGAELRPNVEIALNAFDSQAMPLHCLEVSAPRDEDHLMPSGSEPCAEVSPDCTSSHHGDSKYPLFHCVERVILAQF